MTSLTARTRASGTAVASNWIRSHRLDSNAIHARAVQRKEFRDFLKKTMPAFSDELFYPPHRNRGTPARKRCRRPHRAIVSRLSLVF